MDKRVDVLQLATETGHVLMYRLNGPCAHLYQFPLALRYVLENPFILKVGCACDIDCAELITHFHLCSEGVIDLQYCCDQLCMHSPGSRRRGLHEFVDAFMGKELMQISRGEGKRVAKSNWRSIAQLTQKQIAYAAHDAFACALIYVMAEQKSYGPLRQLPKWIFLCPPER
jgi:ribonuclease D